MSARPSARSIAKLDAEKRMVKRREKEYEHQTRWGNQVQYYKSWEKANNKFEEWTSPRYYETNNQMIEELKKKRDRQENLEKRREKLRKLYAEEDRSYEIELMVRNRHKYARNCGGGDVPIGVLKEVNVGLKLAEEERRKHEAELALYHHWRNNNPILREHERARTTRDIKLSWLDQQVEKRLEKERAEEECRKMLEERGKRLEEEKAKEQQIEREIEMKNERLLQDLSKQIEDLKLKQKESEKLQQKENEEMKKLAELEEIEERHRALMKRKVERELALENLKQHKLKLKQKASDIQENLERERELVTKLQESEIAEKMEDDMKKREVKKAMSEFLKFARDQQDLEMQRQKYFSFVFDSEAKLIYQRQRELWLEEQKSREALLKDVLDTIKEQVDEKIQRNKEKQREVLEERQNALKLIEQYDEDIRRNKEEEQRKKMEWRKGLEEQIKEKAAREKEAKLLEEKRLDLELESARKEEERLRKEIMELQRKQGPIRHTRSRILF
ncbi:hypothetical protein ILUMI_23295 [Ignelater luminosus]|uniref:Trichoplein keratin filament-binding protein n=1 Tax=Ignelater luminosus TaxID=2038154 RepID=A0A8K0CE00_IGNLU|nr:hypothetical protein ILUMI_23295 [Ignelater luminosus]